MQLFQILHKRGTEQTHSSKAVQGQVCKSAVTRLEWLGLQPAPFCLQLHSCMMVFLTAYSVAACKTSLNCLGMLTYVMLSACRWAAARLNVCVGIHETRVQQQSWLRAYYGKYIATDTVRYLV